MHTQLKLQDNQPLSKQISRFNDRKDGITRKQRNIQKKKQHRTTICIHQKHTQKNHTKPKNTRKKPNRTKPNSNQQQHKKNPQPHPKEKHKLYKPSKAKLNTPPPNTKKFSTKNN